MAKKLRQIFCRTVKTGQFPLEGRAESKNQMISRTKRIDL